MAEYFSYTDPVPEGWVEVDEAMPALLTKVRDGLATRARAWGAEPPRFGIFSPAATLEDAANVADLEGVADHLRQALTLMQQQDTTPVLAPSPATRLPVLGRLWALVRAQAHQLVLFYVNRQAANTVQVQQHLLAAVSALARMMAARQDAPDQPEEEVDGLPY